MLDYLKVVPDGFAVVNGTEAYQFSAFCAGVKAGVSATANVAPELFVQMYEAYESGISSVESSCRRGFMPFAKQQVTRLLPHFSRR